MTKDRELMAAWLRDAHAMEKGLIPILQNHAKDAKRHPEVRSRVERHVEETRRHADLVKSCLERLGESTSVTKTAMSSMMGAMQAPATGPFEDELVKNALMDFATENFEIAAYRALVAGAEAIGDQEIARTCGEILREEEDMARFLADHLPETVHDTLREVAA